MKKRVVILGVPFSFGSDIKGPETAPDYIRNEGLVETLEGLGYSVDDWGNVEAGRDAPEEYHGKMKHCNEVVSVCGAVAGKVEDIVADDAVPLILGGDHSITIGVAAGLRKAKTDVGLICFDAHGDFNTELTSITENIHGMVVSACVGIGDEALAACLDICPKVEQGNVAMIGLRNTDPEERKKLKESRINIFTMEDIDLRGMGEVMHEAIEKLSHCSDGVHVSFDMDVVDDREAPGVSLPVHGGLSYRETHLAMELLSDSELVTSMDMVEVNPGCDMRNTTSHLAVEFIASLFGKRIIE